VTYGVADPANAVARSERKHNLDAYELALRQPIGGGWAAYGKVGSSFRVPNVNDNYSLFTATVALLEPQTARDREIGLEAIRGSSRYRMALYDIALDNEILLDPATFTNRNLPPPPHASPILSWSPRRATAVLAAVRSPVTSAPAPPRAAMPPAVVPASPTSAASPIPAAI
jgi:hypothetical protein